jgi:hypothetical protein
LSATHKEAPVRTLFNKVEIHDDLPFRPSGPDDERRQAEKAAIVAAVKEAKEPTVRT